MTQTILVPTDFSSCSRAALERAAELAVAGSSKLLLLHVSRRSLTEDGRREALERLGHLITPHAELKLDTHHEVLEGNVPKEICLFASKQHVDLIVMGTQGRTGIAHLALGSVAERVLRSSDCTVLVVKSHSQFKREQLLAVTEDLIEQFGTAYAGEELATRQELARTAEESLNLPSGNGESVLDSLESIGALSWCESAEAKDDPSLESQPAHGDWRLHREAFQAKTEGVDLSEAFSADEPAEATAAFDLIHRALRLRATDIHMDPGPDNEVSVRMRIDGKIEEYCRLDSHVAGHLEHQLKLAADLDITEPFRPKEGRCRLPHSLRDTEVRITTCAVSGGEAVALRLFSRDSVFLPLTNLGLSDTSLNTMQQMLRQTEGIILVTGPTGSGKTTTVYSMLESFGHQQRNIVSIEDPVEFPMDFVRQLSVDERHGINMTSGLRTLLRMDPDIVFVGEIRDDEAADIAMRAASSGRHVFSTLHTRDVASTITALRDLRIDNRSLGGNLTGIINQRLVRRLCQNCITQGPVSDEHKVIFTDHKVEPPDQLNSANGCDACRGTGFHGRTGIFEVVLMGDELAEAISNGANEDHLRQIIRSGGTLSLTSNALSAARAGITSLPEAISMRWF